MCNRKKLLNNIRERFKHRKKNQQMSPMLKVFTEKNNLIFYHHYSNLGLSFGTSLLDRNNLKTAS